MCWGIWRHAALQLKQRTLTKRFLLCQSEEAARGRSSRWPRQRCGACVSNPGRSSSVSPSCWSLRHPWRSVVSVEPVSLPRLGTLYLCLTVVAPVLQPLPTIIFLSATLQIECCLDAKSVFWHSYVPGFCPKKNCSQTVTGLYLCVRAPIWALLSPMLKMPALKLSLAGAHTSPRTPTCFICPLQNSAATVNNPERSNTLASSLKCTTHTYLLGDCVAFSTSGGSI